MHQLARVATSHVAVDQSNTSRATRREVIASMDSLSVEIQLLILSFLPARALCRVCQVNHVWRELAQDQQLWRSLYLRHYREGDALDELPFGSASPQPSWKEVFKISRNWANGSASSSALLSLRSAVLDARLPIDLMLEGEPSRPSARATTQPEYEKPDTIVQLFGRLVFTASRLDSVVNVWRTDPVSSLPERLGAIVSPGLTGLSEHATVTEMRIDSAPRKNPRSLRLAVFFARGHFSIFTIQADTTLSYTESLFQSAPAHADSIALSRFHFPLLVTCSTQLFLINFWRLAEDKEGLAATLSRPSLRSSSSWSPAVLSLQHLSPDREARPVDHSWPPKKRSPSYEPLPVGQDRFKVVLAFTTPYFAEWTLSVQEFVLSMTTSSDKVSIVSRHTTALPTSFSQIRHTSRSRTRARAAPLISHIELALPWIVASRNDNTIDVYSLADIDEQLVLLPRTQLFGHANAVTGVAVSADGKCVSGSFDGSYRLWDLTTTASRPIRIVAASEDRTEDDVETIDSSSFQLASAGDLLKDSQSGAPPQNRIRSLAFDKEKIVGIRSLATQSEDLQVLSFL
ncbi:uncharacterized protein L969DRAFT_95451 [Mixia osmundae IAM 14324]|uniref:F-box domain-containing protein n=1 Tax=Mixia osmundae (strain CBS 9802 / IAM 14324 / JCM 22182 / KY 12970) TaxID=764103 RepID=G7E0J7_MIXOS|nr:uncharacterized protein L969DRAFT_95451 [Mixia osmundae IAM 14324]KEI38370.1 hypothetical protein L969DRAFT_95451 [Mixia osmundae IAM 14324]GAA96357.1 hypothetical protein E5Q_03023 [Mixia osmundae IAM 14324]